MSRGSKMKRLRSLLVTALACSCANVLDIAPPSPRAEGAGAGGVERASEPSGAGGQGGAGEGDRGGTTSPSAGAAGNEIGASGQGGGGGDGIAGASGTCEAGSRRCAGQGQKSPQVCSEAGTWEPNVEENGGAACPEQCFEGECVTCVEGTKRCEGNVPQVCEDDAWSDGSLCEAFCVAGECRNPPSCESLASCAGSTSCCRAFEIPGGTFKRSYDLASDKQWNDPSYSATLSSFLLDELEVTVGRLRRFVDTYHTLDLEQGDGKAPHIPDDEGWDEDYELPATTEALRAMLACTDTTWTDDASGDEDLPATCVDWYVAYAFCIWDGGRLPTEAEWNYAAAGGDEQRAYPWSTPPGDTTITLDHAFYDQEEGLPMPVGSKPLGDGRWGHADLAGNVYEWTLDFFHQDYPSTSCDDCLDATASSTRTKRGGAYRFLSIELRAADRSYLEPEIATSYVGFRCAHDLPPSEALF